MTFNVNCQNQWSRKQLSYNNQEYKAKAYASNNILLYSTSNQLGDKKMELPKNIEFHPNQLTKDYKQIYDTFWEIFSKERLDILRNGKNLQIIFFVTPNGEVLELAFLFHLDSKISLKEYYDLENAMKGKTLFKVPSTFKDANFLRFSIPMNFEKIYNKNFTQ